MSATLRCSVLDWGNDRVSDLKQMLTYERGGVVWCGGLWLVGFGLNKVREGKEDERT